MFPQKRGMIGIDTIDEYITGFAKLKQLDNKYIWTNIPLHEHQWFNTLARVIARGPLNEMAHAEHTQGPESQGREEPNRP